MVQTMTRDEHRAKCIEAMATVWLRNRGYESPADIPEWIWRQTIAEQTAAFNALYGVAFVNPRQPTAEMIGAGQSAEEDGMDLGRIFKAMATAGDLTNPQEKTP